MGEELMSEKSSFSKDASGRFDKDAASGVDSMAGGVA